MKLCFPNHIVPRVQTITTTKSAPPPPPPPKQQQQQQRPQEEKKHQHQQQQKSTLALQAVVTTVNRAPTVQYLNIVISAVRGSFKVKSGEGECDAVIVWNTDNVDTAQSVGVIAGKVGGLYDACQ